LINNFINVILASKPKRKWYLENHEGMEEWRKVEMPYFHGLILKDAIA